MITEKPRMGMCSINVCIYVFVRKSDARELSVVMSRWQLILSAKEVSFVSLRLKGSELTKKDQITVAWRLKITKNYGITLVLEKYCNTIRNRWQEGRCFVSKKYFVFKPPYESSMTAISFLVFHESWYTKPFSDGFWDIETPVKKCFWKYWGRGKRKSLLYQDIKA